MRKYLCKIFRFLLDTGAQLVDLVKNTVIEVGTATVDVLSELASAASSAIFKNPVALGILLFGAWFIFLKGDKDDGQPKQTDRL